jgi:hypothetical protein
MKKFGFDLLFEVQVPRAVVRRQGTHKFHEAIEQAVFAEQMGFDTVWIVEHHFLQQFAHSSAPEVMLGALSQRTSRMRLGQGVALLPGAVNHPSASPNGGGDRHLEQRTTRDGHRSFE